MLDVPDIAADAALHLVEGLGLASVAGDLAPAGDAWLDVVADHVFVDQVGVFLGVLEHVGAGAHDAHSSTLMNCGSSSMLVLRSISPHLVTRGSFLVACRLSAWALIFMLRNFRQVNSLPLMPVRFWRKKTGPGMVSSVTIATTMNTGTNNVQRKSSENAMSNARLMARLPDQLSGSSWRLRQGTLPIIVKCIWWRM